MIQNEKRCKGCKKNKGDTKVKVIILSEFQKTSFFFLKSYLEEISCWK